MRQTSTRPQYSTASHNALQHSHIKPSSCSEKPETPTHATPRRGGIAREPRPASGLEGGLDAVMLPQP